MVFLLKKPQPILKLVAMLTAMILLSNPCGAGSIIFRFEGLSKPESRICLDVFHESERDFFLLPEKLDQRIVAPTCFAVTKAHPVYDLQNLKPGRYGAAFFEDLDGEGKIRLKSIFGMSIPASPIGFSQNPLIFFGPPSFNSCSMVVDAEPKEMVVKMKRLL